MRIDHKIILTWIENGQRVLDLGCGDGTLLQLLQKERNCRGYGIDINEENILRCVVNGVNVIEQDIEKGLNNFDDHSFDVVIMSQTIQTMQYPDRVLQDMLRVGKQGIITFPNFGHWRARLNLLLGGKMPVSDLLPYEWYNTPNIHFCTVKDFDELCKAEELAILNREVVATRSLGSRLRDLHPNLFCETALYRVTHTKAKSS